MKPVMSRAALTHVMVMFCITLVMLSVIYSLFSWHRNEENVKQLQQTLLFFSKEIEPFFKAKEGQAQDFSFLHSLVANILLATHTHIANVYVVDAQSHILWSFHVDEPRYHQLKYLSALIQKGQNDYYLRVFYYPLKVSLFEESWLRLLVIVICLAQILYELMRVLFASSFELGFWAEMQTDQRWQKGDFSQVIGLPKTISREDFQHQLLAMRGVNETFGRLSRRYRILLNSEVDASRREEMTAVFEEATAHAHFSTKEQNGFLFAWAGRSEGRWLLFLSVLLTGGLFLEVSRADFLFSVMIGFVGWCAGFFAGQSLADFVSKRVMLLLVHVVFIYSLMLAYVHFGNQEIYEFFPAVCWGGMGLLSYIFMSPVQSTHIVVPQHERPTFPFYGLWLGLTALTPFMNISIFSFNTADFFLPKMIYVAICWAFFAVYSCLFAFRHPAWDQRSEKIRMVFDWRQSWREWCYVFFVGMSVYHILSSFMMYDSYDAIFIPMVVMLVMGLSRLLVLRTVMTTVLVFGMLGFSLKVVGWIVFPLSIHFIMYVAISTVLVIAYHRRALEEHPLIFRPANMLAFFGGMLLDALFRDNLHLVFAVLILCCAITVIFSLDRKMLCAHG